MNNAQTNQVERESSDFKRVLEALKQEGNIGDGLATDITKLANGIKKVDSSDSTPAVVEKNPTCLVEDIWSSIWRIQENNINIRKMLNHLYDVFEIDNHTRLPHQ